MSITYKPVVIIIDDFTTKSSGYSNISLYDAGYLNSLREHDFYTDVYGYYDGYGDVDYSEYLFYDETLQFHNVSSAYGYNSALVDSGSYIEPFYGYTAYYNDYVEWVAHSTSPNTLQHGDWVLDAFRSQAGSPSDYEVILIDLDSDGGYINSTQSNNLFSLIQSGYSGATMTTLEGIIEEWVVLNNTETVQYLPVVLSYSIAGPMATQNQSYALEMLAQYFTTVVQAIPNVSSDGFVWGDTYSDVVNVGAYNVDSNGYSLHGNPMDPAVVDILANGYIEHSGWGPGYNFGTSFATPRVAAEITNLWIDILGEINYALSTGEITQDDLEDPDNQLSYASYVETILNEISAQVYIEIANEWINSPVTVLADDIANSPLPQIAEPYSSGLPQYHVTDAAYTLPLLSDAFIHTSSSTLLDNVTIQYYKDSADTNISTLVDDGGIVIDTSVDFDYITLSQNDAYTNNIDINDVVGVLDNIAQDINTASEHASDMDNNGVINIFDIYAVLDSVGGEPQTFDVVDANGNLVTSLDADSTNTENWAI
nr:hypothetical protein [Porticoccaceae bacterium]